MIYLINTPLAACHAQTEQDALNIIFNLLCTSMVSQDSIEVRGVDKRLARLKTETQLEQGLKMRLSTELYFITLKAA